MTWNNKYFWIFWFTLTLMMTAYLSYSMTSDDQSVFIPGETSHGHYQIELRCKACHGDSFGGKDSLQKSCVKCHGKELKEADDKHPKSKFTDPRNAERTAVLDARYCITCHVEHKPEITREMGVTVAADVCYLCHYDIAKDRKSHDGMAFDSCGNAGCHNFHDNRALYEDYLVKHQGEENTFKVATVNSTSDAQTISQLSGYPLEKYPVKTLSQEEKDAPATLLHEQLIIEDWHQTSHAKSGVNCSACHLVKENSSSNAAWVEKPTHKVCEQCHGQQVKTFLEGRHGMRLAQDLSPMSPKLARQPMRKQSYNKTLNCVTCHNDHKFDVEHAAVEACLACHNDKHSLAYKDSTHYQLWLNANIDKTLTNTGVSCATCHLPRKTHKQYGEKTVFAQHNQNDNLRPNEKMIRSVCMNCHGLGFSIDALADEKLVANNFQGKPGKHIESIEMAQRYAIQKHKEKKAKLGDKMSDDGFL
jgi:hypothetical protein